MKITGKVKINCNRAYVINKFLDASFVSEYDSSISKYENTAGAVGQKGNIIKYTRNFGGRILIEEQEVLESDIPNKIVFKITVPGTKVTQVNIFEAEGGETIWSQESNYKFPILMHWFVTLFQKKAFEKDYLNKMNKFKDAIEKK